MIDTVLSPWQVAEERFHCEHERQQLVKYQQSNGAWRVRRQCQNCGEYTTSDLPQKNVNFLIVPAFDESLRENYRAAKRKTSNDLWEQRRAQEERERTTEQQEWQGKYNCYLQSDHWKQLRRIVLQRDHCKCQNCFRMVTESSAHIHHLSYTGLNRVGKSFAFECVTLCRFCHVEFHPRMQYE